MPSTTKKMIVVVEQMPMSDNDARMLWKVGRAAGFGPDDVQVLAVTDPDLAGEFAANPGAVLLPLGGAALMAITGLNPITDWRGYVIGPEECCRYYIKVPTQVPYKAGKKCACFVKATKGGQPSCPQCQGSGWLRRAGDMRTVNKKTEVDAPASTPAAAVKWIVPSLSPLDIRKSGLALLPVFGADVERAWRAATDRLHLETEDYSSTITPRMQAPELVVDLETGMYQKLVTRVGIAAEGFTGTSDTFIDAAPAIRAATTIIAHNASFDIPILKDVLGIKDPAIWDTMLAAYMAHPDGRKGLNWTLSHYLDVRRHKHKSHTNEELYNALDAKHEWALYKALRAKLASQGQLEFFERGMMPALPTLMEMHTLGIERDVMYIEAQRTELRDHLHNHPLPLVISSPIRFARMLGLKNSDEETLLAHRPTANSVVQAQIDQVLEFRDKKKQLSTYFTEPQHTRAFPSYLPGARDDDQGNKGIAYSGRPTASKPNIQNQPPVARRQFIADSPDDILISLDFSQIEPRITAALAEDEVLAADLDTDVYAAIAATLSCERKVAKTVFLLSAYLGSPKTLQNKLMVKGILLPYRECKALQDKLFARYSRWAAWRQRVIAEAKDRRELRNVFGKWAPFIRIHPAKAVNFHPQSNAACILWYCLPQVAAAIAPFGARIVTTVHDEILLNAPKDKWQEAADAARDVMTQEWPQIAPGFRVPVGMKMGANWRDMYAPNTIWSSYALEG